MQRAGIRYITVNAFYKGQLSVTAEIVALPVAGTRRALAPVLFHIASVYKYFICRRFVKPREVSAQHTKVAAHCKRQRNMIVVNYSAVRANGYVYACFFEVFVSCFGNVYDCRCLSAPDSFCFARYANGTTADADFYKICARVCQKSKSVGVYDVSGTYFYAVTVAFPDPCDCTALPFRKALRRVDAQHVRTCVNQCGNALGVVACIYSGSDNISFL